MATTIEEITKDALASANASAGVPIAARWANNRYREMVNRVRFRHLRKVGELSLSAEVSAGTVSATRGSTTITPNATAQAAWLTSPGVASHQYWFIRLNSAWYRVASVDAFAATITLNTAFSEEDVSAGTYKLIRRYYPLASDARWIGDFLFDRLHYQLLSLSLTELNIEAPTRILTGNHPKVAVQIGVDTSGYLMFEFYPPPTDTELLHYIYWSLPSALTFSSEIPLVIDPYILKEGILIDIYRYEKTEQIKKGNIEAAAVFANEEAKQRTIWEGKINEAKRSDRGVDDISLILQTTRGTFHRMTDQRTAHDFVFSNWRS